MCLTRAKQIHTYVEPHCVLLNFLGTLALFQRRRLHPQVDGQLCPGFDLFLIQLSYQFKQSERAKRLPIALRRAAEYFPKLGGVRIGGNSGVAIHDEVDICFIKVVV